MVIWFVLALMVAVPGESKAPATVLLAQAQSDRQKAKDKKAEGDSLLKAGKRVKALAAYRKAAALDTTWYEPHEAVGNMLFSAKRYIEAVETFKKAVEIDANYTTGYYNIAFAYRKAKKYQEAAEYYRKYIERKPSDPDAFYGLAVTYESLGDNKRAIESYQNYALKESRPSERQYVVKAKNRVAKLQAQLEPPKPPPTEKKVETVATAPTATPVAAPKPAPAPAKTKPVVSDADQQRKLSELLARGDKAMKEKAYTTAMKSFFDAVRLAPKNPEALYRLGLVYQATGNPKAAKLKWKAALAIDSKHAPSLSALRKAEGGTETKTAVVAAPSATKAQAPATVSTRPPLPKKSPAQEKAVPLPNQAKQVAQLLKEGDAQFKQKSFSRAIAKYTRATQLDTRNEEGLFKLGMAYALSGNYQVAVYKWQKVLEINPNNKTARRNIDRAKNSKKVPAETKAKKPPAKKAAAKIAKKKKSSASALPNDFASLMARAHLAKKKGDASAVLRAANKALTLKEDVKALLLRGEALVVLKKFGKAKRAFTKAMVLDPNLAAPFYGLAETCRLSGDNERAQYYFRLYVRSTSNDVSAAKVSKAKAYLKQGK